VRKGKQRWRVKIGCGGTAWEAIVGVPDSTAYDLLIIGGGINGCGIARDAAGRGLRVLLCEKDDLACGTSSASTKLIHGGLRYLETYEFRLVREALIEREVLLAAAPHIVWPLSFVLPHDSGLRPAWLLRLGLFLYDHLGGRRRLPASRSIDFARDPAGRPLKPSFRKGFSYADCWVEDSRLVVLSAMDARERGAEILTRTRCTRAQRSGGLWEATLEALGGGTRTVRARALVNAAGPWVNEVLRQVIGSNRGGGLRLVKGSHIVVPRLYDGAHAYILQNEDRRIVFVIPYEERYSLIGTTDVPYTDDLSRIGISEEETRYLCNVVNRYFANAVTPDQAVWTYAGVRPLYDDASENVSAVTRDYVFDVDRGSGEEAPLLSIFGGKITTFRKLAEHALEKLLPLLGREAAAWTGRTPLPGGDIPGGDFDAFLRTVQAARPWLPPALARRYVRAYGTRAERILRGATSLAGLGEEIGDGLHEAEVEYLIAEEWAETAEDILWRRSKLGLHVSRQTQERLAGWLMERLQPAARMASR
jgi:glycerol-3-phosphate dehydrogenase